MSLSKHDNKIDAQIIEKMNEVAALLREVEELMPKNGATLSKLSVIFLACGDFTFTLGKMRMDQLNKDAKGTKQ